MNLKVCKLRTILLAGVAVGLLVFAGLYAGLQAAIRYALPLEEPSMAQIVAPLPRDARVIADWGRIGSVGGGERYFVVSISASDFREFTSRAGFTSQLKVARWPGCLEGPGQIGWIALKPDDTTVYTERGDALEVAHWIDGRMYLRHHVP